MIIRISMKNISPLIIVAITAYLVIINIISFALMGIDKKRARKGEWRISEAALFTSALLFGALGSTVGMWHFRHKTKHWYFVVGMPAILIIEAAVIILLICAVG